MITIIKQPSGLFIRKNASVQLEIIAETDVVDGFLKYQWESSPSGAGLFQPLTSRSALTPNLFVDSVELNTDYRCVVTEFAADETATGEEETSDIAEIKIFTGRTSVAASNTRLTAKVKSRLGKDLEYVPDASLNGVVGLYNIGEATPEDADTNILHHNIQSAIVDLATAFTIPVGGTVTEVNDISPAGASQETQLTFVGSVVSPNPTFPAVFELFGQRIPVADAGTPEDVRDAVVARMLELEAEGLYFVGVNASGTNPTLNYKHRDHKSHPVFDIVQHGVRITGAVAGPARYGYGRWTKIVEQDLTDVNNDPITLYTWVRTA